eukprot:4680574-Alexandrium_andersonii.AAC.1
MCIRDSSIPNDVAVAPPPLGGAGRWRGAVLGLAVRSFFAGVGLGRRIRRRSLPGRGGHTEALVDLEAHGRQ